MLLLYCSWWIFILCREQARLCSEHLKYNCSIACLKNMDFPEFLRSQVQGHCGLERFHDSQINIYIYYKCSILISIKLLRHWLFKHKRFQILRLLSGWKCLINWENKVFSTTGVTILAHNYKIANASMAPSEI